MSNDTQKNYTRFMPELLIYARYLVASSPGYDISMAEELLQQVMVRAHDPSDSLSRYLADIDEPVRIKKYLKQVLKNQFMNHINAESRNRQTLNLIKQDSENSRQTGLQDDNNAYSSADRALQSMCSRFNAIRQSLDTLTEKWPVSNNVDYHAVFLVCLRKTLLRMIVRSMQTSGTQLTMASMQRLSRMLVPWHDSENDRSFLPGYPEIGPLWKKTESLIKKLPDITDTTIVVSINNLGTEQRKLELNTYQQWVLRAKRMARAELDDFEWNNGIGLLFRSRSQKG
jgi:DNA-directed RNA polymerase specialized sigma24 family protein